MAHGGNPQDRLGREANPLGLRFFALRVAHKANPLGLRLYACRDATRNDF